MDIQNYWKIIGKNAIFQGTLFFPENAAQLFRFEIFVFAKGLLSFLSSCSILCCVTLDKKKKTILTIKSSTLNHVKIISFSGK